MKYKRWLFLLGVIYLTGFISSNLWAATARIIVISDIAKGSGGYASPYTINSTSVQWRVDVSGTNQENTLYWVQVHMDYYRSCATQYEVKDLTYAQLQNKIFSYTATMAGWYYIRVDLNENGQGYKMQDFETLMVHVFFRVPPLNSYNLPYSPPSANNKPVGVIEVVNKVRGTGEYNNPIIINEPIIRFRIDGSYDPDGVTDLVNGVCFWAIHIHGFHPVYAKTEDARNAIDTFLFYPEIQNKIYSWDIRERPSSDGYYMLYAPIIDQHGEPSVVSDLFIRYEWSADYPPYEEPVNYPPLPPQNVRVMIP